MEETLGFTEYICGVMYVEKRQFSMICEALSEIRSTQPTNTVKSASIRDSDLLMQI